MSTLKVDNIRHNNATSDAITMASDGTCTANITNNLSNRNIVDNGEFVVDQRGFSSAVTQTGEAYTIDRWKTRMTSNSKFSVQKVADAPAGFYNSAKITSLDATTVQSGDYFQLQQGIEGYNINPANFGTPTAKGLVLSFYVKSSLTGTFSVCFSNYTGNKFLAQNYTISSANTWERKTISVPAITTGSWERGNGAGLYIYFTLGAGSDTLRSTGSWIDSNFGRAGTGSTNVVATNGATWHLTGVQLEVDHTNSGTATDFEHRSYGDELQRCRRYYQQYVNISAVGYVPNNSNRTYSHGWFFPVAMRAKPTLTLTNTGSSGGQYVTDGQTNRYIASALSQGATTTHMSLSLNLTGDLSDYRGAYLFGTENTQYQTTYKILAEL